MTDVQEKILEIFKEIVKVCNKYDIPYYAIGGTCLGAVRHKGFIPWDDDMDIAIPIEDIDRFIKIAKKELPEYLYIYTGKDRKRYDSVFIKICDRRTTFIEKVHYNFHETYKGVFVDVMPLAGIPEPGIRRIIFYKKLKIMLSLNTLLRMPSSIYVRWIPKFFTKFLYPLRIVLPYNFFLNRVYHIYNKYPYRTCKYTGYVWSLKDVEKLTFPKEWFGHGINLPFEDIVISCPLHYSKYLQDQFGNYMELPPENERKQIHEGIIDLNNSYEKYLHGELKI